MRNQGRRRRLTVGSGSFEQLEGRGLGSDDVLGKGIVVVGKEGAGGFDGKARASEGELGGRGADEATEAGGGGGGSGGRGGSSQGRH